MLQKLSETIHLAKKIIRKTFELLNFFTTFVPDMYTLRQAWHIMHGEMPLKDWDGKIYCCETDAATTLRSNETHGYMKAYTFTLVTEGWLTFIYNGKEITLHANDLYTYSPGMPITIIAASDNYRGMCLLVDEHTTIETPAVHDLVHVAYQPLVQLHEPVVSLPSDAADRLAEKMREIISYLHSDHIYKAKILQMLYAVFLLEIQDMQDNAIKERHVPQRMEEIFIGFMRLLPQHFAEEHSIGFYASQLNISNVYLSRVVRQVSRRTVIDYINQMLLMEASFLLRTTQLSISQIADRLHFADTPSFSKFFTRLKGTTPKEYRNSS